MKKFAEICLAILFIADFGMIHRVSEALRCFSCSITSQSSDSKCLTDPISAEGQSVVNCNKKYCTILRQELKDPPGKINTFVRGCEEVPTMLDDVIDDPTFRTFYRTCSSDLCNDGDGTKSSTPINLSPDGYSGENLLVPGMPINSSSRTHVSLLCILIVLFINLTESQ